MIPQAMERYHLFKPLKPDAAGMVIDHVASVEELVWHFEKDLGLDDTQRHEVQELMRNHLQGYMHEGDSIIIP